mmetsp:Transcript_4085/g.7805  ORF Transcript_4085/g.7805 Transcript_4085/m.7805 type:complete len:103 (+) Transcript_4085:506-814(+)
MCTYGYGCDRRYAILALAKRRYRKWPCDVPVPRVPVLCCVCVLSFVLNGGWLSFALSLRSSAHTSQTALRFAEGFCMCNAVASLRYVHAAHDYCNDVRSIFT